MTDHDDRLRRLQDAEPARRVLRVGAADDVAEADADRRADEALSRLAQRQPVPEVPQTHVHGPGCDVRRAHRPDAGATIGAEGGDLDAATQQEIESAARGGEALPAPLRRSMEEAFGGGDLGRVRVHRGAQADRLSRSLSAEAFTTGEDIFFSKGAYAPATARGQRTLAHELGHVLQSRTGVHRLLATTTAAFDPLVTTGIKARASTFTRLRGLLAEAHKATTPDTRAKALQKLNDACLTWLNDHGDSTAPKDADRRKVVDQLLDELGPELARATQQQAQGIYLDNATGAEGKHEKHNLRAISSAARGTAAFIAAPTEAVADGDSAVVKARKDKKAAAADAGLSAAEYSAIATFTAQDYKYINPATANSKGWMQAQASSAQAVEKKEMFEGKDEKTLFEEGSLHTGVATQGLSRLPAYPDPVYRGASMDDAEVAALQARGGWSCASLASSSKSNTVAEGFASSSGKDAPGKLHRVLFKIENSGGRDVEKFSKFPHEKEVLLLAGSDYVAESIVKTAVPKSQESLVQKPGVQWWLVTLKPRGRPPVPAAD